MAATGPSTATAASPFECTQQLRHLLRCADSPERPEQRRRRRLLLLIFFFLQVVPLREAQPPGYAERESRQSCPRLRVPPGNRHRPDELDGLELPVTVEVMRERVDFLHSLGLTVADINNYPLVLGCSVKKNMVPVLDYLGKIGVRRSTFTDFLRRYPQVLHASVVIDLAPVDVPRVLEKYPELLGFKLEGTMSTSVAYLVGIGVSRREIGAPGGVSRVLGPAPRALARLIEKKPHILGFGLEEKVKPNVEALLQSGVRRESMAAVIAQHPEIIGIAPEDLKQKLLAQQSCLESTIFLGAEEFGRVLEKMPLVVGLGRAVIVKHVDFFKTCGFSLQQVKKMVISCPQISLEYFQGEMDGDLEDLAAFPAFFTYSLESTIRPRHRIVAKKGLKCSLAWLLNCTDAKFEERMNYDSIGMEEMEPEQGFNMRTFLEPRAEEEEEEEEEEDDDSDYEDDEDSDDDYA
ncbi:unnamed protein product [Spirodela intermedia]|uniref:Uncharacterized protein n=1 Tax=Spirodela intermedia TaxID=51605 RepID=A0A7I8J043_SPIIN|nr:unnamed protein product [Spirodela intermedia]CAA6663498.1 unnamed protein product [Spirodela intermedia]